MDDGVAYNGKYWAIDGRGNSRSSELHHRSIPQDSRRLPYGAETTFGSDSRTQTPCSVYEQADALQIELSELRRLLRTDLADQRSESSHQYPASSSMRDHPPYDLLLGDTFTNPSTFADEFVAARRVGTSNSLYERRSPKGQRTMDPSIASMTLHALQARINQETLLTDMLRTEQELRWLMRRQEQLMTLTTLKRSPRAQAEDIKPSKKKIRDLFAERDDDKYRNPSSTRDDSEATRKQEQPLTIPVAIASDKLVVSPYQQLLRDSLEFFVVSQSDKIRNAYGRDYGVKEGQVGIRCLFCAHRAMHWKGRGSLYFPGKVTGVYQAAQNLGINHLLSSCSDIPDDRREKMAHLRKAAVRRNGGGKRYWEEGCRSLGLFDYKEKPGVWLR